MKLKIYYSILVIAQLLLFFPLYTQKKGAVDLIIFTFNRPLQLYALLESLEKHTTGLATTSVIYKASSANYEFGYTEVKNRFPNTHFMQQHDTENTRFKNLMVQVFNNTPTPYVLFAVDDIIITDHINLYECTSALEATNAYGFYLRLGKNITYSYMQDTPIKQPTLTNITPNIYAWEFTLNYYGYWQYPNTVDLTIYKKSDIHDIIHKLNYEAPPTLEGQWSVLKQPALNKIGLCYEHSKMINIPMNRVQDTFHNKHMDAASPEELLALFNKGLKIDIDSVYQFNNNSAHIEHNLTYVPR